MKIIKWNKNKKESKENQNSFSLIIVTFRDLKSQVLKSDCLQFKFRHKIDNFNLI